MTHAVDVRGVHGPTAGSRMVAVCGKAEVMFPNTFRYVEIMYLGGAYFYQHFAWVYVSNIYDDARKEITCEKCAEYVAAQDVERHLKQA